MSCPSDDTLLSWRAGKLHGDEGQAVEQHVDQCADCQAVLQAAAAAFDSTSAAVTPPVAAMAPGELVGGRYRIVRFVGSGGMGAVYEAMDEELGEPIALKTLHERFATDPHAVLRLKREALLARRITHPNACRIFDVGYDAPASEESTQPTRIFLTMELLRGETLRQRLRRGRLSMSEARPLVEQMAAALGAAHAGRIIHRDFKSDNVILVETQAGTRAVVTDFGLARAILGDETRLSRSGALIGTPAYMAPEQILAGAIDTSVDIYALGVVMFEMLTGELPFGSSPSSSPIKERLTGRPPSPRTLAPELSASWERVVTRCLEPEPGDRFARVAELVAALDAAPPRRRSRAAKLAITTGALIALGLGALVAVTRRTNESAPWSRSNRLFSVTPSIAPGGATITLDGLFGSAADARFAGAAPLRVTAIGPHHATVQVPESARSGELTVARWSGQVGAAPFRRTSFPLGVGMFERYYEQADGGRSTPALTAPREYHSSLIIGDSLYVIGGFHREFLSSVERATINADGSLSSFSIVPNTTLQTARDGLTSTIIGNSLYVIGGNVHGALDSIERATVAADGSLSAFSTVRNLTLNTPRTFHTCEVIGDSLYVIGGVGVGENRLASIERATIHADGSLGAFSTISVQLGTPRSNHTSLVFGGWLYVIGGAHAEGDDDVEALGSVERATILPDGSLSSFTVVSQLAVPRGYHSSALLGDELYVVGGHRVREFLSSVERATLHADGSLDPFAVVPGASLTVGRASYSSVVVGNSIYVIGGCVSDGRGSSTHRADLERATVDARGDLGPFSTVAGTSLVAARSESATVVGGDSLYLVGGFSDGLLGSVEHARIHADGSLSPWEIVPGVALIKSRRAASSVIVDGDWLYIIGGIVDGGLADATIERARIRKGSLSPFSIAHNSSLATARSGHASVVVGDSVYVIGGADQQGHALALSERARIVRDGWLSSFTPMPELALTTARHGHTLAVVGDWLYVIGGVDAQEHTLATVERARIRADGTLSPFAPVPGLVLNTARHGHAGAVVGDWLYVIGGENGGALGSIERAAIGPGGELARFSPVSTTLTVARHAFGAVVLGNWLDVIGGRGERPLSTLERAALL
jgi:serine/threonine protein kinase/N-acetylneuraminic acid mutarotase